MPWVGFEPTISACERPKTYALDRAATGTGFIKYYSNVLSKNMILARNVARIGEGRISYRIFVGGKPGGKRPHGRPRLIWEDNTQK